MSSNFVKIVMDNINNEKKKSNAVCENSILKEYRDIKIACILDKCSYECFKHECNFIPIKLNTWMETLIKEKPNLLFVESAWRGNNSQWIHKIANLHMNKHRSELKDLVEWCKQNKIPTVFWAKGDPYDFTTFIEAAKYFDYVFTTDVDCIYKYKNILEHNHIYVLPFAAQPKIHNPILKDQFKLAKVALVGDWYDKEESKQKFAYEEIINSYKKYDTFLNIHSVEENYITFGRSIFELLACGTPVVSRYLLGREGLFHNIIKVCKTEIDAKVYLKMLLEDKELRDRLSLLGQREVFKYHTYQYRLEKILDRVGMLYQKKEKPGVSVITCTNRPEYMERVFDNYTTQKYPKKEMIIVLNNNSMNIDRWKEKSKQYDNVSVFQLDEEKTLGACLNFAVERTTFEIISKFDDDDYYGPEYLTDAVNAFKYTDAAIVGKYTVYAYLEDRKLLILRSPNKEHCYRSCVLGSTLTFKKEIFRNLKFHNRSVREDTIFLNECTGKGYKIYATDRFNHVVCRRLSPNNHTWKITEQEFLKKCKIITQTEDYKKYVTV